MTDQSVLRASTIEAGDEVFFIAASTHIRAVMKSLNYSVRKTLQAHHAGGGGQYRRRLARRVRKKTIALKLIERDQQRRAELA